MSEPGLIAVAMSGGLDSSVTAWMLAREGRSVVGLSMLLWDQSGVEANGRCCGALDLGDARRVAQQAGIPHYTLKLDREFRDRRPFEGLYRVRQRPSLDLRRKAIAFAGDSGNGVGAEDLAQCRHLHLQVVLLDD